MGHRFTQPSIGWGNATNTFTLTAHATPHTKGDWTDILAGASVLRDVREVVIEVTANVGGSNTDTSMLLDIGLGGSGTSVDLTVVTNVPLGGWNDFTHLPLPLHVPAGVRIAGRIQAAITVDTLAARVWANYGPGPPYHAGFHEGTSLNMNTATSAPSHNDLTDNAYEEIVASAAQNYRAFQIIPCGPSADTAWQASTHTIDLGVGAGGAEQKIGEVSMTTTTTEILDPNGIPVFYYPVAAGSRLALRKNTANDQSGTILAWR